MKSVLLALVGMTPAVLTETVWALATKKKTIPDKIVVLTTTEGQAKIEKELLNSGVWKNMKRALAAKEIDIGEKLKFGKASIKVFPSKDEGDYLSDINTLEDNEAAADCIMENIRFWSDQPETTIWASLAGGRKTMSALMMSCMSLLGRKQDHVLHVLVNSPYDSQLDPLFFFPEKNKKHTTRDGKMVRSSDAKIKLIDVPFVKMKGWYKEKFNGKNMPTYRELVETVQESVWPEIVINYDDASLTINNGEPIFLKGYEFAPVALKVGNGINILQEIQSKLKKIEDEINRIWKGLKEKGVDCESFPWKCAKKHGIPTSFNDQTPKWIDWANARGEKKSDYFQDGKSVGVTKGMNAVRTELKKCLSENLVYNLLPKRDDPVKYPKEKIILRGKNPFTNILE